MGACDLGMGRKLGRDGVSKTLQGKYVPYSPDMAVNVYLDAAGKPVRASMKQCDNWFSGNAPRPVAIPAPKPTPPAAAAPVVAAPVVAAAQSSGVRPYVFGSVGALRDGVSTTEADANFDDRDVAVAGQIGAGIQFNDLLGAEVYYQGGGKHKYKNADGSDSIKAGNHTVAARLTVGTNITDKARVFAKAGVAGVQQRAEGDKQTKARATAGIGATYDLTDNWAVRADYDHYFKRNGDNGVKWKGADYLGIGAQYKF
ncbi:porin family protein [Neisseria iguanae]|uniref:porin family protein n=1 Tax=Neisseria iguanae TaxID=90242 RepID=UPI001FE4AE50|nr:porin family protein [Neisseria iguanae]